MLTSLQSVLPSSVLSSISNTPAPKNQPREDAADAADRDNYPSPSSNTRVMSVDEQGVKKKKGRSNEVSFSFPAFVCEEAPQLRMRFSASSLFPSPLVCYHHLCKPSVGVTDI